MVRASALVYAIVIALVIAILTGSLIAFSYFSRSIIQRNQTVTRVINNLDSGLELMLTNDFSIKIGEQKIIDLYEEKKDSLQLEKKSWGIFEVAICKSFSHGFSRNKIALLGAQYQQEEQVSLYLADLDKPLSICGKTLLKGLCYLPQSGIKRAYIEGQSFSGDKMVDGVVKPSSKQIPSLNKNLIQELEKTSDPNHTNDSLMVYEEAIERDTIQNSFNNRTLFLYSNQNIELSKMFVGNIKIVSAKRINVKSSAILKEIILFAPEIVFEDGFSGAVQAYAHDTLQTGKKCLFSYPSVLGIVRYTKSPDHIVLSVGEQTAINGIVFAHGESTDFRKQQILSLNKETLVKGYVYSSGLADVKGVVHGTVMCQKFILSTPSSVYENHLLNAEIDRSKLSSYFSGLILDAKESKKVVAKWLN